MFSSSVLRVCGRAPPEDVSVHPRARALLSSADERVWRCVPFPVQAGARAFCAAGRAMLGRLFLRFFFFARTTSWAPGGARHRYDGPRVCAARAGADRLMPRTGCDLCSPAVVGRRPRGRDVTTISWIRIRGCWPTLRMRNDGGMIFLAISGILLCLCRRTRCTWTGGTDEAPG